MKRRELEAYLRENPQAAKHADSIQGALAALRKLHAVGIGGEGYTLVEPYGDRRAIKDISEARDRGRAKGKPKLTENA